MDFSNVVTLWFTIQTCIYFYPFWFWNSWFGTPFLIFLVFVLMSESRLDKILYRHPAPQPFENFHTHPPTPPKIENSSLKSPKVKWLTSIYKCNMAPYHNKNKNNFLVIKKKSYTKLIISAKKKNAKNVCIITVFHMRFWQLAYSRSNIKV